MDLPDKEKLYGGKFDLEKEMYNDVNDLWNEQNFILYINN